ncbi:MAG: site-specific DNA-methyltransferase [Verrucomicrobiota bacterium]|nr:site-specific DNA-methyltransferase [Verrucomicrobiota bacterium]
MLKKDPRFVDDDGELLIAAVQDRAWKIDHDLVKLLLADKEIKAKFFDEIAGHWVFNLNTFIEYVSQKNFLDNSYTRFRNHIGLTIGDKYLRERGDVSLAWPYKDTVLEGGQTKEDEKRKEIFFNEVLAEDEITRLHAPKVLTGFVRFTAKAKQLVKDFKRDENGVIRENLIVKGNNLLALHSLKVLFGGTVKLIFLDPPYNTDNDSFRYNDSFNHSTWLTFMKNRLEVAASLLSRDGAIFVQCDDQEQAYLRVLLDEVFGRENFLNTISIKVKVAGVSGSHEGRSLGNNVEYIHFYAVEKNEFYLAGNIQKKQELMSFIEDYKKASKSWKYTSVMVSMDKGKYVKSILDGSGAEIKVFRHRAYKIQSVQEVADNDFRGDLKKSYYKNIKKVFRTTNAQSSIRARVMKETADIDASLISIEYVPRSGKNKGKLTRQYYKDEGRNLITWLADTVEKSGDEILKADDPGNLWDNIQYNNLTHEGGVEFPNGKKPEKLIENILTLATEPKDIVLDFFVGSGTTAAVAHKTGRQYIGIEQLDYGKNDSITRLRNVIKGDDSGISKSVNWNGGGEFISCELMKYNEAFMERIETAKTSNALVAIWQEMAEGSFLNWYVNPQIPDEAIKDFEAIGKDEDGLKKQKRLLAQLLDKNQLYVNLSEIDDVQFKVSAEEGVEQGFLRRGIQWLTSFFTSN